MAWRVKGGGYVGFRLLQQFSTKPYFSGSAFPRKSICLYSSACYWQCLSFENSAVSMVQELSVPPAALGLVSPVRRPVLLNLFPIPVSKHFLVISSPILPIFLKQFLCCSFSGTLRGVWVWRLCPTHPLCLEPLCGVCVWNRTTFPHAPFTVPALLGLWAIRPERRGQLGIFLSFPCYVSNRWTISSWTRSLLLCSMSHRPPCSRKD